MQTVPRVSDRDDRLLIISDHLEAGMEFAVDSKDKEAAVKDIMAVLRAAFHPEIGQRRVRHGYCPKPAPLLALSVTLFNLRQRVPGGE